MKMKTFFTILFLMLFAATAGFGAGEEVKKPDALAVGDVFEFEPVLDGDEVIHNFVIRNTGNAELEIERVQTG